MSDEVRDNWFSSFFEEVDKVASERGFIAEVEIEPPDKE
jgi:hypothetical protein